MVFSKGHHDSKGFHDMNSETHWPNPKKSFQGSDFVLSVVSRTLYHTGYSHYFSLFIFFWPQVQCVEVLRLGTETELL